MRRCSLVCRPVWLGSTAGLSASLLFGRGRLFLRPFICTVWAGVDSPWPAFSSAGMVRVLGSALV